MTSSKKIRVAVFTTGAVFMLWFYLPTLFSSFHIGNATGMIVSAALMLTAIFWESIKRFFKFQKTHIFFKILTIIAAAVLLIITTCVILLTAGMISAACKAPPEDATVVVLGCKISGENPSLMLAGRLKTAENYLKEHPEAVCIVSGGQGENEIIPEAEAMAKYLINRGIAPERIYLEKDSKNTEENLEFSKKIIEENGLNTQAAIISDGFHLYRAELICNKIGLEYYGKGAFTNPAFFPAFYVRELYGLMEEIFLK